MRKLSVSIMVSLVLGAGRLFGTNIPVPDGNFQGNSSVVIPPVLLGTASGSMGTWTASFTGVLSLGGLIESGTATSFNGPTPTSGTYEIRIELPANLAAQASLFQLLTNKYQANSVYTLSVDLDQGTLANLAGGTSLSLSDGTTTEATLSGQSILSLMDTNAGFQTVHLVYKTGNVAPTNNIGILFSAGGVLNTAGSIYVDNFTLTVNPVSVQTGLKISSTNVLFTGSGGAPNATYYVLASTNLSLHKTNWPVIVTNHFDASGNFSQSIYYDRTIPQRYFCISIP